MSKNIMIMRRYWGMLRPKFWIIGTIFLSKILASIASLFLPITVAGIVKYMAKRDMAGTLFYILLFGAAFLFRWLFYYFNYMSGIWNRNDNYNRLQSKILNAITKYDLDFPIRISPSLILHTVSKDIVELGDLNDHMSDFTVALMKILAMLGIISTVNLWVGLLIGFVLIIYLPLLDYFTKKDIYYLKKQKNDQDKIVEMLSESLSGKQEMISYGMEQKFNDQFSAINRKFQKHYQSKRKFHDIRYAILPFIRNLGKIAVYFLLVYFFFCGKFEIDFVILVIGYYELLSSDIDWMSEVSGKIKEKSVSIERIHKVLAYQTTDMLTFGIYPEDHIVGRLEFKHVTANYQKKEVLKNVSFSAEPRQITALVGHSGSGKTTILNLLLRLYKREHGEILIDNVDINFFDSDVYFSNVSVVNQRPFVFSMTIRDNLSIVDSSKKHQEEICQFLGIHEEILELKDQYQTRLDENGINVSTELKQMLCLARSLLTQAEILLFDEITSSLDVHTSKRIARILKHLKETHTIILVTHQPELMKLADQIVVLHQGKVVEKGTLDQLEQKPYFQKLKNYD